MLSIAEAFAGAIAPAPPSEGQTYFTRPGTIWAGATTLGEERRASPVQLPITEVRSDTIDGVA
ncbi:MAG: hypothetical protein U0232_05515 [Thermomicrobiales bacterium]